MLVSIGGTTTPPGFAVSPSIDASIFLVLGKSFTPSFETIRSWQLSSMCLAAVVMCLDMMSSSSSVSASVATPPIPLSVWFWSMTVRTSCSILALS